MNKKGSDLSVAQDYVQVQLIAKSFDRIGILNEQLQKLLSSYQFMVMGSLSVSELRDGIKVEAAEASSIDDMLVKNDGMGKVVQASPEWMYLDHDGSKYAIHFCQINPSDPLQCSKEFPVKIDCIASKIPQMKNRLDTLLTAYSLRIEGSILARHHTSDSIVIQPTEGSQIAVIRTNPPEVQASLLRASSAGTSVRLGDCIYHIKYLPDG